MTDEATYQRLYADYCERGRQLEAARAEVERLKQEREIDWPEVYRIRKADLDAARAESEARGDLLRSLQTYINLHAQHGADCDALHCRCGLSHLRQRIDAELREG